MLFGLAAIPLALGVGVAVDYGRALLVRERMQSALDASALAVGGWPGLSDTEMQTKAQQYFDANYLSSAVGTVSPVHVSHSGNAIIISVSSSVPTTFMKIANIDHVDVGASTTVVVGMGTAEVALALDNSGSMAGSKINRSKPPRATWWTRCLMLPRTARRRILLRSRLSLSQPELMSDRNMLTRAGWIPGTRTRTMPMRKGLMARRPRPTISRCSTTKDFQRRRGDLGRLRRGATHAL